MKMQLSEIRAKAEAFWEGSSPGEIGLRNDLKDLGLYKLVLHSTTYFVSALLNKQYKPISEITNSSKDVASVFKYFFPQGQITNQEHQYGQLKIHGKSNEGFLCSVTISDSGLIESKIENHYVNHPHPFHIVDFIRNLGYEPL